jgi:hypothetical protein
MQPGRQQAPSTRDEISGLWSQVLQKHEFVFNFVCRDHPAAMLAACAGAHAAPQADQARFGEPLAPQHFAGTGRAFRGDLWCRLSMQSGVHLATAEPSQLDSDLHRHPNFVDTAAYRPCHQVSRLGLLGFFASELLVA